MLLRVDCGHLHYSHLGTLLNVQGLGDLGPFRPGDWELWVKPPETLILVHSRMNSNCK